MVVALAVKARSSGRANGKVKADDLRLIAARIHKGVCEVEHTRPIYFRYDGKRLLDQWNEDGEMKYDLGPPGAKFTVLYPYRPSFESCLDMVRDFFRDGLPVTYDERRWLDDPRIEEQAGPSVLEDAARRARVAA